MDFKEMRQLLARKNARWSIPQTFRDDVRILEGYTPHPTGALPLPRGAIGARLPRVRVPLDRPIRPWKPGSLGPLPPPAGTTLSALPAAWDWRNVESSNWITPARSQGGCGSCVAFGVTAAAEAHFRIARNEPALPIDLSEASMFFTSERQCDVGDPRYGWNTAAAMDFVVQEGVALEEDYPYVGRNQEAVLTSGSRQTIRAEGYDSTTNTTQMKRWLVEEGPLVAGYTVYTCFDTYWRTGCNGVYTYADGTVRGGHVVLVVGYNDADSCWICKNSWGATSGAPDGCFRIGYGECGIDGRMFLFQGVHDVITRDELRYDPAALRIVDEGARGFLLTDGRSRMKMFDNREDARNGLRVARRYTRHGFIGRDNPRPNRRDYIVEYWSGSSGLSWEPLTTTDAISFTPGRVVAEDMDADGWRIADGSHSMLIAHDMNDALAALDVVQRYSRICFIGRNNRRPDRKNYIMTYWE